MKKVNNFRKMGMIIAFIMMCAMILNPIATAQEFSDLRPDYWCYNKIVDFEERGYVTGYDDGEFKPDRTITRAEYVTIVNNFFGYATSAENTTKFLDVSEDDWFAPYVSEAVERGYISGYPDGTFRPYEPIRRQEATVILSKILNIADEDYPVDHEDGLAQYDDGGEVEDWAYKAVHSYSVYNFINGYEDNTIRLFRDVTRAETVQLLNTVEEKVVIDRDNKTNEIKSRPSGHTKRTATPVITVVETNDNNSWYNEMESEDGGVNVKVTTTTTNATITVKVNGEVISTTSFETEGTGVIFNLPEGEYEIVATATRSKYKTSYEAKSNVGVDVTVPKVSGKVGDMGVFLSATDNLSGIDTIQYAWFVKDTEDYKRVSNWAELEDYVELPKEAQNYYIGVKGSDIAGNIIDGGLRDSTIDDNVTDGKTDEPYEIVNEARVIEGTDEEQSPEDEPSITEFAITYYKNDGTDVDYVQKLTADATVLKGAIFSRDQYKLIGWAEIATGNKTYDLGEAVNFTENKDLYAVWQLNEPGDEPVVVEVKGTLTIHYIYEENEAKAAEDYTSSLKYGEEYNVPSPEIVGYAADMAAVSGVIEKDKTEISVKYKANTYTVSYNANGGENAPSNQEKIHGKDLILTSDIPLYTGYTFAGWTTNQDGTGDNYAAEAIYAVNASVTLYAKWVPGTGTKYTVYHYFENVNDTNYTLYKTESDKVGTTDAEITLANEKIAIVGGTYKQGSLTEGGDVATTTTISSDGTTKIYLYYSRNTYTLTLDKNPNVSSVSGEGIYKYGASVSIDATIGSANGYTYSFTDWTSSDSSLVQNQTTKSATMKMPAGDVTLTANASKTAIPYKISYELDEGAVSETNPIVYTVESETITLKNPTKEGYTFVGWTGTGLNSATTTVTIPTGSWGDRKYTASWKVVIATLTVDPNGGIWETYTTSQNYTQNYNTTKNISDPTEPTGYTIEFDTNGGNEIAPITQEIDFKKWILTGKGKLEGKTYTFGSGNATLKAEYDEKSVILPTPKKAGYDFEGWYEDVKLTGNGLSAGEYIPTASIMLYAKWTEKAPDFVVSKESNYPIEGVNAEAGDTITYTIKVTNKGEKSENIVITDNLNGKTLTNVKNISDGGVLENNIITWKLTVDAGKTIKVTFKASIPDEAKTGSVIENTAVISARDSKVFNTNSLENSIEQTVSTNGVQVAEELPNMNVVLVMDLSGSMLMKLKNDNYAEDGEISRIAVAKTAAANFVENLYQKANSNERITFTLVGFNSEEVDEEWSCGMAEHTHSILECGIKNWRCPYGYAHTHKNNCKLLPVKYTGANVITFDSNGKEVRTATRENYDDLIEEIVNNVQAKYDHGTYMDTAMKVVDKEFDELDDEYPNAKNIVILLADGDYEGTRPFNTVDSIKSKKNHNAKFYTIGFGPDASKPKKDAYKTLKKISSNDTVYISNDLESLIGNFNKILDNILTTDNAQSSKGKIEFIMTTSNYYPIVVEYKDPKGVKQEITITDDSELATNHITIVDNKLSWDISGDNYAGCTELKISYNKIDDGGIVTTSLIQELYNTAIKSIELNIQPVVDVEPEVEEELKEDKPVDDSSSDTLTSVQESEDKTKNEEDENISNESTDDSIQVTEIEEAEDEIKVEELEDVVPEQVVEDLAGAEEGIDETKKAEPEQKGDDEGSTEEKTDAEPEEEPVETTNSTQPTENGEEQPNEEQQNEEQQNEEQPNEEQTVTEQSIVSEN